MRRNRGEHGSGLIEFIFVAPIILLLAGSTLEVARYMRFRQIALVLSQEAANRAYSQCADITSVSVASNGVLTVDEPTTIANIKTCLTNIHTAIETAATTAGIVGSKLNLSVYRHNLKTLAPALNCPSDTNIVTEIFIRDSISTFTTSGGEILAGNVTLTNAENVCKRGRIVIAVLALPYTTIINYRVFGLGFNSDLSQSGLKSKDLRGTTIL